MRKSLRCKTGGLMLRKCTQRNIHYRKQLFAIYVFCRLTIKQDLYSDECRVSSLLSFFMYFWHDSLWCNQFDSFIMDKTVHNNCIIGDKFRFTGEFQQLSQFKIFQMPIMPKLCRHSVCYGRVVLSTKVETIHVANNGYE